MRRASRPPIPTAALAGTMVPLGDAKGTALALMVELLAAGLTGANFAAEASSFLDAEGPPPGTGQLMIAFDPAAFGGDAPTRFAVLAAVDRGAAGRAAAGHAAARGARESQARGCYSDGGAAGRNRGGFGATMTQPAIITVAITGAQPRKAQNTGRTGDAGRADRIQARGL